MGVTRYQGALSCLAWYDAGRITSNWRAMWYADLIACTAKLPNLLVASSFYICCQGNPLRLKELELALPLISSQEEAATSSRQGRVHATCYAVSYEHQGVQGTIELWHVS